MKFFIIACCIILFSCKKNDPSDKFADNHIEIEVFYSTGSSSLESFHGSLAPMFISTGYSGEHFQANGKISPALTKISFAVAPNDPTNKKVACLFHPGGSNSNSYSTSGVSDPGTITFTTFSNNFAEGVFLAKCTNGLDSIVIRGTFKGRYN